MINRKRLLPIILAATMMTGSVGYVPASYMAPLHVYAAEAEESNTFTISKRSEFAAALENAKDNAVFKLTKNITLEIAEDAYPELKNITIVYQNIGASPTYHLEGRNVTVIMNGRGFGLRSNAVYTKNLTIKFNGEGSFSVSNPTEANFTDLRIEGASSLNMEGIFKGDVYLINIGKIDENALTLAADFYGKLYLQNTQLDLVGNDSILIGADGAGKFNPREIVLLDNASYVKVDGVMLAGVEPDDGLTEDQRAAEKVIDKIETMDPTDWNDVIFARMAYDELTDVQKALVTNYSKLVAAEEALQAQGGGDQEELTEDEQKAYAVTELMEEAISSGKKEDVEAARAAYEVLTDAQKALVDPDVLTPFQQKEAEIVQAEAEQAQANQQAADKAIEAIGKIDPDNKESIEAARAAYNNLTEEQKALVPADVLKALEDAEKAADNTNPGTEPGIDPGTNPGTIPSVDPGTNPGTDTEQKPSKNSTVAVTKISIKGESTKIAAGKKIRLSAVVAPKNASDKKMVWTSSNKKYATVNGSGLVTTKKAGKGKTVKIVAATTDGKVKAVYSIQIKKGIVKAVKLTGKSSVKAGKSIKLKAKVKSTKGAYKGLKWKTSNAKYATVKNGKVMTTKAGKGKSVKITAYAIDGSGKKATKKIKIK